MIHESSVHAMHRYSCPSRPGSLPCFMLRDGTKEAQNHPKVYVPYLQDIIAHNINSPAALGRFRARKNIFLARAARSREIPRACLRET